MKINQIYINWKYKPLNIIVKKDVSDKVLPHSEESFSLLIKAGPSIPSMIRLESKESLNRKDERYIYT